MNNCATDWQILQVTLVRLLLNSSTSGVVTTRIKPSLKILKRYAKSWVHHTFSGFGSTSYPLHWNNYNTYKYKWAKETIEIFIFITVLGTPCTLNNCRYYRLLWSIYQLVLLSLSVVRLYIVFNDQILSGSNLFQWSLLLQKKNRWKHMTLRIYSCEFRSSWQCQAHWMQYGKPPSHVVSCLSERSPQKPRHGLTLWPTESSLSTTSLGISRHLSHLFNKIQLEYLVFHNTGALWSGVGVGVRLGTTAAYPKLPGECGRQNLMILLEIVLINMINV